MSLTCPLSRPTRPETHAVPDWDGAPGYASGTGRAGLKFFEKYPDYVFNYEGAIHYMWFKEYHPQDWAKVQQYVADGRWRLAGTWINAVDTNMPSPESLMRQALYAKRSFRQEFNKTSQDIYLPDCFGLGFALPSIGAHCGIKAFSTQNRIPPAADARFQRAAVVVRRRSQGVSAAKRRDHAASALDGEVGQRTSTAIDLPFNPG